jgi:Fe-S cluster assembly ATP-binding protein
MLKIENLHVSVEDKEILSGINLTINAGEVHAIMGPNGSGKSTLANVIAGRDGYEVTQGSITFLGEDLLDMEPNERAAAGMFLAFQYPVEIPGVNNLYFLKSAYNAQRKVRGEPELDAADFMQLIKTKMSEVKMDQSFLRRPVNVGFSGGEKKRNEILQMSVLEPSFAVLDETDSGLDIDALQVVSEGVNLLKNPERGFLVITHYQRLLNHIVPDVVHVLVNGKIEKSGGKELAQQLEAEGYVQFRGDDAGHSRRAVG